MSLRPKQLRVRVSQHEHSELERRATEVGQNVSDFVRSRLFGPADRSNPEGSSAEVSGGLDAEIVARVVGIESEMQSLLRHHGELSVAVRLVQKMTAASIASAAMLRDVTDLPPDQLAAEINRHIKTSLAASGEVEKLFGVASLQLPKRP